MIKSRFFHEFCRLFKKIKKSQKHILALKKPSKMCINQQKLHLQTQTQAKNKLSSPFTKLPSIHFPSCTQCLKITEEVAFNIASEASYVCILSRQKFIKNAKNGQFGDFLKNSNETFWVISKHCECTFVK